MSIPGRAIFSFMDDPDQGSSACVQFILQMNSSATKSHIILTQRTSVE